MHICTVIELASKFVTVIDNRVICISRHKDYSLFHFKAHDVKALKVPISKFIFVDPKGEVDEVILADQLKDRGVNYTTAKRDTAELTDVEQIEVSGAVDLARAAMASGLKPMPEADFKPPVAPTPAYYGVLKLTVREDAAAGGLSERLGQAESTQAAGSIDAGEVEAAAEATATGDAVVDDAADAEADADAAGDAAADAASEGLPIDPDGNEGVASADAPVDDRLATVKPSRKKRRR
jgi:hypothetical protein